MKVVLTLEEVAQFALGILFFIQLDYAWWWFPVLLLTPDLSMLGYLINNKVGAYMYNFVHHKGVAIVVMVLGYYWLGSLVMLIGTILFAHSAMDRVFGYGLKYLEGFSFTHLGRIGKQQ